MPESALTGTRIRERRMARRMRQSELASRVGVSPSYLNLIEHNRRRIGGKLLIDIAAELEVEPSLLAEGAEAALIARLRSAAESAGEGAEMERAEDFAGRFPGWAQLIASQRRRIGALERAVETLNDRLAHDPHLAATLHEVLDTVTAIRSTAAILADTREIEPEWRDRFHRNINEDAQRLAEGAQALVGYLDAGGDAETEVTAPQEEVEAFFAARGYQLPELEEGRASAVEIVEAAEGLASASARAQAVALLERWAGDARAMPLSRVAEMVEEMGPDPLALAARMGGDIAMAMRRIAALPGREAGLLICDGSGMVTFRRAVEGFALPRFGAGCPLWPLYRALARPMVPLYERLGQAGRGGAGVERAFGAFAVAQPQGMPKLGKSPLYEAHMLILPDQEGGEALTTVGATCRVCSKPDCAARREPSIMTEGF
ncbi:helix-turn-helix domain-containing protein [Rhodalgimonas zhirmunskyi]|uniref:Helix-turn-helix domain-containing protein n=1 Tax=Rhodalgimonas zhirmunskyi TaxID=2964767 RepID=A0AAJ1U9L6_9RHOB|nr:helix-turn-helix domain-containing protein [Rhodoalgimonas zhirmunskyi]MDQ2095315.1 helix-turn-helix domain-containing protein [Rhodoalgimonas zhirmunskyi]